MKAILSPSLLSADFACLGDELARLQQAGIYWVHLDIMDGRFVPNLTFGGPVVSALRKVSRLFFDVHLMIEQPEEMIEAFGQAGADLLAPHLETMTHPQKILSQIRHNGMKAGLALNPGTDFNGLRWLLPYIDMILIMGVNPGFSGQKFIPETIAKIQSLRCYLQKHGRDALPIQIDGGVDLANAATLIESGANILVSGSAFFKESDYTQAKRRFADAIERVILTEAAEKALEDARSWQSRMNNI